MCIESLLKKKNMTMYRLSADAGVPYSTLNDICSGKTRLEKCGAETVYKLAKALDVPMERLVESAIRDAQRERSYEVGLPEYLQHDLDACKDFTAGGKQLFDFCSIKNTILDSDSNGSGTELSEILETIEKQQFVDPGRLLENFWDMFVIDALLGNFDRHNGNWRLPP